MKAHHRRGDMTSLFGFHNQLTLASYVPKPRKCVLAVCAHHHETAVAGEAETPKSCVTIMPRRVVPTTMIIWQQCTQPGERSTDSQ